MTTDRHEATYARLEEYALGQLPPDERRDVQDHAVTCEVCASELSELMLVIEGLGRAAEPVTLPPALKNRVLKSLANERTPRAARLRTASAGQAVSPRVALRIWSPWLAAAAAVVLVLGSLLFVSLGRYRQATADAQRAQADAAELRTQLAGNAQQTDLALSILTAGDVRGLDLSGSDAWGGSAARAYWSPTRGLLVVADRLPLPPPGRIYQVWVISGATPVSAGLLGSQPAGRGMLIVPPPGGVASGPVTVAVTDEPPGGLPAPSGAIRLAGSI